MNQNDDAAQVYDLVNNLRDAKDNIDDMEIKWARNAEFERLLYEEHDRIW